MPKLLRSYLVQNLATDGSSLLIRVADAVAGRYEVEYESWVRKNNDAILRRNGEIADAAHAIMRRNTSWEAPTLDLATVLLARGFYCSQPAPDPIELVLKKDGRFVYAGFDFWRLAAVVTVEDLAVYKTRRRAEEEFSGQEDTTRTDSDEPLSSLNFRRANERTFLDIKAVLHESGVSSVEEANTVLQDFVGQVAPPRRNLDTALDRAQDLMYDAWGCTSQEERIKMARKALTICSDCADAYVLLAEETTSDAREVADLYAKGVAAGRRALGEQRFKDFAGEFWVMTETRPYMRALHGLTMTLWDLKRRKEALAHAWEMLDLNPGDNQGMRYRLLGWLLDIGEDANAKRLLEKYPGDITASWAYARALLAFRTEGDTDGARELREKANKVNTFVPAYLTGRKRLPAVLPDRIGFGDESEAMAYAEEQMAAWRKTPNAIAWLEGATQTT